MFLLTSGFSCSSTDSSLFISHDRHGVFLLLVYVDDIISTGSNPTLINQFIIKLGQEFAIKDLGYLHYFLGVEVHKLENGILRHHRKYAAKLLA